MVDVTLTLDGEPITVTLGTPGPMGPASGPLGSGSVTAATISNDTAEQTAIVTKLGLEDVRAGIYGNVATKSIDTNLAGAAVPANGPIFIGLVGSQGDGITLDSGANFPPGIAYRRYNGTAESPTVVTAGLQTGYTDFRAYSGTQFWNHASIDVVVDNAVAFTDGNLPPARMRFATAYDNTGAQIQMELSPTGCLEIGAIDAITDTYSGPGTLGDPKFYVTTKENDWTAIIKSNAASGAGYALRLHTNGETVSDYLLGCSSNTTFKFRVFGNGVVDALTEYRINGTKVVGAQGAAVADATDAASVITQLNALLARLRAHGLIAT